LENVLYDAKKKNIFICDFGLSKVLTPAEIKTKFVGLWGSPQYLAPEMYMGENYDPLKTDVYSLGVLLYILLFRVFPFTSTAFEKKRTMKIDPPVEEKNSSSLKLVNNAGVNIPGKTPKLCSQSCNGIPLTLTFPKNCFPSIELKQLLHQMLIKDFKSRPTIHEILHHPWIQKTEKGKFHVLKRGVSCFLF